MPGRPPHKQHPPNPQVNRSDSFADQDDDDMGGHGGGGMGDTLTRDGAGGQYGGLDERGVSARSASLEVCVCVCARALAVTCGRMFVH